MTVLSEEEKEMTAAHRWEIIAPLFDQSLDKAAKKEKRKKLAEENGISTRTIQRYEAAYKRYSYAGLRPHGRKVNPSKELPQNYEELIKEAINLKRELPTRSVNQIIFILEGEGKAAPGVLKRTTVQQRLYKAGFGKRQMKKYIQDLQSAPSSKRFCKPHRMMLEQADIKYGVGLFYMKNGQKKTIYLSSIIDDHSRYILWSEWYEDQDEYCVENVFRKAILKNGKMDAIYTDNGSQYVATQLRISCAMLGIRLQRAPVRSGQSKGKIEKFHQVVDSFISEARLMKYDSLEKVNEIWWAFLSQYYHKKPHEGIKEYYISKNLPVPEEGITPEQEWIRDSRPLTFIDTKVVAEAFCHHEFRVVDKAGCIKFKGKKYEVGTDHIGQQAMISFDPDKMEKITVSFEDEDPVTAKPIVIEEWCKKGIPVPESMKKDKVQASTSRFLEVIEKKKMESDRMMADAISYGSYEEDN